MKKDDVNKSKVEGERLHFDLSYENSPSLGDNKFWFFGVDQATKFKWCDFLRQKMNALKILVSLKLSKY